nr:hypothetical protein [Yoonia sp.]
MTEINDIGSVESTDFPIHRIIETRARWRQVYEGLQIIESHIEAGVRVPLDSTFGGMLGHEWQPRLAELPERLRANLKTRVLPAIKVCCNHPSAPHQLRDFEQSAVSQITGVITDAARATAQISQACTHRPSRRTQLTALRAAQNLLAGVLMMLDDILAVAVARDASVK